MADTKVVVITGASRGLGLALVQEFAARGWQVVGTGRSERPADLSPEAVYKQSDASNAAECEAFWQQLHTDYPEAAICLVNNAGGYVSGSLVDTKPEDFMQQMQSCYFSAVYMTRAMALVVPRAQVINVISSSALVAHKDNSAYGAAKAAQMHFFQSLQHEFKPRRYQITNLYPSDIATHGNNPAAISAADLAQFVREQAENSSTYYLRDVTVYPTA